ncbi:RNA polymerase sigma factor [Chitinophagaceae bacterium LWZ2-11]
MQTSLQLIKDCIKGKRQAQQELYLMHAPAMLGVCYRYTKSIEDAEDVLQEGFIKVFTRLHQFKNTGDIGAWIRRIMVNTAISYLQKHARYRKEMNTDEMSVHPVSDDNPEVHIDTKDLAELIQQLPAGYQTIFNLVAVEGFDHTEISELLQMNVNTVRSQYSRARAMLITLLKKSEQVIKTYEGKV